MKVTLLNNNKVKGGAYRAAHNIHKSLLNAGIESTFPDTIAGLKGLILPYLDRLPLRIYPQRNQPCIFSPAAFGVAKSKLHKLSDADILHLNWINGAYLSLKNLKWLISLGKPIVWTLHDFWAVSGGCHINFDCSLFENNCGSCPVLGSKNAMDISRTQWLAKKNMYDQSQVNIVVPSEWLNVKVKTSSLFQNFLVSKILNPLDTDVFKPRAKFEAMEKLNLNPDKYYILTGGFGITINKHKGFSYFIRAMSHLKSKNNSEKIEVLIFGDANKDYLDDIPFVTRYFGMIENDHLLANLYNAADVFVCSSIWETGPTTIAESMACGTPVVSFTVGAATELIDHKNNGYLSDLFDYEQLSNGLNWIFQLSEPERKSYSENARRTILQKCSYEIIGKKYLDLYLNILSRGISKITLK